MAAPLPPVVRSSAAVADPQRGSVVWRKYVELVEEGFVPCAGTRVERREARSIDCSCGEEMFLRTFELIGDERELIARRTYALCVTSGDWVEF